jgi:predicted nuclease of predicted toxin-antitoxin system
LKLLFDHNLSPKLVTRLADIFPESSHVYLLGLAHATDQEVWVYARKKDYTVVSKDADFVDIAQMLGAPPRLVWVRRGNCSVAEIETMLRKHHAEIALFYEQTQEAVLAIL